MPTGSPSRWRPTLAGKFIALSLSGIVLTSAALSVYVIRVYQRRGYAQLFDHGESLAAGLAERAELGVYTEDIPSLRRLVASVSGRVDVAYVAVLDPGGSPLAAAGRLAPPGLPGALLAARDAPWRRDLAPQGLREHFVEVVAPVVSRPMAALADAAGGLAAPAVIGFVQFGMSDRAVRAQGAEFVVSVLVFVGLIGAGVGAVAVWLARRLTHPIRRLREATHSVVAGRLEADIQVASADEIGDLAADFADMLRCLRSARGDLEERNRQLAAANRRLMHEAAERQQTERELRASEERYSLAARAANDGLWDWDRRADRVYYSPRWRSMLGLAEGDAGDEPKTWLGRIHPDDREGVRLALERHAAGRTPVFEAEHRIRHADGSWRWVLARGIAVRDESGRVTRIAGSQSDITQRKEAEERLVHEALHDELTGLPNRALLVERLSRALSRRRRLGSGACAILFMDIDRFKWVNDSLGHPVGDRLLVEVAARLRTCLRDVDTVARLGVDEFVVLIEGVHDVSEATRLAERIRDRLAVPFTLDAQEVYTAVSIGIALSNGGHQVPAELLRNADLAMYRAKRRGDGYQVFDEEMHHQAVSRLQLENDLRRGIERGELFVHYQPIYSVGDGHVEMVEALVRWRHPFRGLVPPSEFIALAEESNLIVALGRRVLEEAAAQAQRWRHLMGAAPPIAVNLSGKEILEPEFVERLSAILHAFGLDPTAIALEVTESAIMERSEAAVAALLQGVRGLGIQLLIDDFGTGVSSLANLHRFPVTILKIDRSFVARMVEDAGSLAIVRTILQLARTLALRVVAEGVESEAQLLMLREMGCDLAQGFFLSRPLPAEQVEPLLARLAPAEPEEPARLSLAASR